MEHQILLFYKYITIDNPEEFAQNSRVLWQKLGIKGRMIVASEGLNVTCEGSVEATEEYERILKKDSRFSDIQIKKSKGDGNSFPKISIKVRSEIVSSNIPLGEVDPRTKTANHLSPSEMKEWYTNNKDFVVVDMRNTYEFESGHFKDSVDAGMRNFRDLPLVVKNLLPLKQKTVVTVCTGGVRCEKASAYLLSQGFSDVHQLDGGIQTYMEKFPGEDYLGALYTFDNRVTMDFCPTDKREVVGICRLCLQKSETYINCKNEDCHLHFICCTDCQKEKSEKLFCNVECQKNPRISEKTLNVVNIK